MAKELKHTTDVSNTPELLRLAEEVARTRASLATGLATPA